MDRSFAMTRRGLHKLTVNVCCFFVDAKMKKGSSDAKRASAVSVSRGGCPYNKLDALAEFRDRVLVRFLYQL